jgi:hypothetical protein
MTYPESRPQPQEPDVVAQLASFPASALEAALRILTEKEAKQEA